MTAEHSPRNTAESPDRPGEHAARTVRTTSAALSQDLPVTQIRPSPTNPRQDFDEEGMAALVASVAEHGVVEPVIVLRKPDQTSTYELIAGHRRWLAAGRAGLDRIPARVLLGADAGQALAIQAVENLQRQDLNAIEEARQFKLLADSGQKQAQIARTVGKSQPYVANRLRMLDLPEDVQELIRGGKLSPAHGVSIARFSDFPAVASKVAELAAKKSSTVKDLDQQKLPFSWELEQHKLIVPVYEGHNSFDPAICKACPFGAYRVQGSGWCLNPPHAAELKEAAKAEREREAAERTAAIRAEHPNLADLVIFKPAEHVQRWQPPTGCTGDCPCAARVAQKDHAGNLSLIDVCTNREYYEELQRLDRVRQETAKQRTYEDRLARAVTALSSASAAALIAWIAFEKVAAQDIDAAITHLALDYQHEHKAAAGWESPTDNDARRTRVLVALSALGPLNVVRLTAEAVIRHELRLNYTVSYGPPTPLTDSLLGDVPAPEAEPNEDEEEDDYPRETDIFCDRCEEPITVESVEEDRLLAQLHTSGDPIAYGWCRPCTERQDDNDGRRHDELHTVTVGGCPACEAVIAKQEAVAP